MMTIKKKFHIAPQGFTLVELLVALAVFMVVITISLGSIISILDAGRKSRALKSVMTNLNFTFEVLSRDLKFGKNYYCGITQAQTWTPQNCTGSGTPPEDAITFVTSDGTPTIYRLNGTQLEKSTNFGATYIGVTSPEIVIEDLKFFVFGAGTGDDAQPRATVLIRGYAGTKPTTQSRFVLQTSVSQRGVDQLIAGQPEEEDPPPPAATAYRYIKWEVTKVKNLAGTGCNCVQAAEFKPLQDGAVVAWPAGTTITNPGGSSPTTPPNIETPPMLIDGANGTKWLDWSANFGSTEHSTLIIDVGVGNDIEFNGYRWTTADDVPSRDPVSWVVSGSNDGATYTVLDTRTNESIDNDRFDDHSYNF